MNLCIFRNFSKWFNCNGSTSMPLDRKLRVCSIANALPINSKKMADTAVTWHLKAQILWQINNNMSVTYSVGSCQVNAQTTSSRAQQKHKDIGPCLKVGNHISSVRYLWRAVQPYVRVFPMPKEFLCRWKHLNRQLQMTCIRHPCIVITQNDLYTHTQPFYCSSEICPGPPGWAGTRKVKPGRLKPIWIYWSKR